MTGSRLVSRLLALALATATTGLATDRALAAPPGALPPGAAAPTAAAASPAWTAATVAPQPGQPAGYTQFQNLCAICHGAGPGKPGTRALAAKYAGKIPALLEERRDLTADFVKYTVRHGVSVMPPIRKTELSDADMEAIAAYLTRKRP